MSADEWLARALASVLEPRGYGVTRAASAEQAVAQARAAALDVLVVDARVEYDGAVRLCGVLRVEAGVRRGTPLVVVAPRPLSRGERMELLRAGAWDCLALPLDSEELLLKLQTYGEAKAEADRAAGAGLVDPPSGLYNRRGLERRVREFAAEAVRRHTPLACVALAAERAGAEAPGNGAGLRDHVARVLGKQGRTSDAIGRVGPAEFVVVAPATDAGGAERMAERLAEAVEIAPPEAGVPMMVRVWAGYDAVTNSGTALLEPTELLEHSQAALRQVRARPSGPRIGRYGSARGQPQ